MLVQRQRSSIRVVTLVIVLVVALAGLVTARALAADPMPDPTAALETGGVSYRFTPTTCTITDSDFLAAGAGQIDGQDFWISASPEGASLTVGSADGTTSPGPDDLWLTSIGDVRWSTVDVSVEALLTLHDERDTRAPTVDGILSFSCSR